MHEPLHGERGRTVSDAQEFLGAGDREGRDAEQFVDQGDRVAGRGPDVLT